MPRLSFGEEFIHRGLAFKIEPENDAADIAMRFAELPARDEQSAISS